jgi:hypothetical protein
MTSTSDYIDLNTACGKKYLPVSKRRLAQMCLEGKFKTAFQPGAGGKGSKWLILRAEVLQHRINGHANPLW